MGFKVPDCCASFETLVEVFLLIGSRPFKMTPGVSNVGTA